MNEHSTKHKFMAKYLGETAILQKDTEFKDYLPTDWALEYIVHYGGIDGAHHKSWVLDQVVRILNGTKIEIVEAKWDNGQTELRFSTGEPSEAYLKWVDDSLGEAYEDPENTNTIQELHLRPWKSHQQQQDWQYGS